MFVRITNIENRDAFPAKRLLEEYRDQGLVEQRFAFIKGPKFIDGLYLHTPRRQAGPCVRDRHGLPGLQRV